MTSVKLCETKTLNLSFLGWKVFIVQECSVQWMWSSKYQFAQVMSFHQGSRCFLFNKSYLVSSVAQNCLFSWELKTVLFFLTLFLNRTHLEGKKLNVSISGEEYMEKGGKRLQRRERGQGKGEEEGRGIVTRSAWRRNQQSQSDPQPVHSLMPWSFPRNAATLPL